MSPSLLRRILAPVVEVRDEESVTALLMFAYSFLAMTAYNIIQPLTRSKLIASLGAVNVPYVVFGSGLIISVLMVGYTRFHSALPRRWALPITQAAMAVMMLVFWTLFRTSGEWVSVAFYLWGLLLGVLLISQFWTLANGIYDPRQAKRLFGFVGGGVALGGMTGAGMTALIIEHVGANTLLVWSAGALALCAGLVAVILGREASSGVDATAKRKSEEGVTLRRALQLLTESRQVQLIALVIGFGSLGAALIDQQVNMAAEAMGHADNVGKFLAQIRFGLSAAAFVIQVGFTSRIHRYLGIGFALLMLPTNLGATAVAILLTTSVWAPAVATIMDRSVRYTVDKTTREVLFLPLPSELRQEVKPFVDVTVDRMSRGIGAIVILVLIQPWGLHFTWFQLSFVSLALSVAWWFMAIRAKREYLQSFRQSIERHDIKADEVRVDVADFATVETLIEELASPDDRRVLYAIDLLDALDKRNLVTPLLLHHESLRVRVRALKALAGVRPDLAERWLPAVERLLTDEDPEVRAAAVRTLAALRREGAAALVRPYLDDRDPRLKLTAAVALADSAEATDRSAAARALETLVEDPRESASDIRREVARSLSAIRNPQFRNLLIPLIYDADIDVALEAIRSAGKIGAEALFVPPLVSLLRRRALKAAARDVLVGYGEPILDVLAYFLREENEDLWVRRHLPATLARIPSPASMDLLVERLTDPDGFLRYKAVAALETLKRERPDLKCDHAPIESLVAKEAMRSCMYLSLQANLRRADPEFAARLLSSALQEKLDRGRDRIHRLLGLLYGWKDVAAARWALEHGDGRAKASAAEFLDNLLKGDLRKRVMPVVEDLPVDERVRKANVLIKSRPRDLEETVAQLVHDDDQVVSAAAIHYVEARQIDALGGDLEHALAHRDARDWSVFEAASWALASRRMSVDERRARWKEPLPAVEVVDRLRHVPLFAFVSVDELFRIVAIGHQARHEPGRRVDEPAGTAMLRCLLDGRVLVRTADRTSATEIAAPAVFGFDTVLAGAPSGDSLTAADATVVLELATEEFLTLLSANTQLAAGLFRTLIARAAPSASPSILHARARTDVRSVAPGELRAVDKVLVLQDVPIFARATADELLALAAISRDVPIAAGADLFAEGEPAAVHVMLAGSVQLQRNGAPAVFARSGDAIGVIETLGGGLAEARARGVEAGAALRIDRDALFEVLSDRIDLLRGLFSAVKV
ncbi:MAG: HEAT repeat domain-containing protein [Acidobacteria bacterium]|nr:HEAT repeat domain-containing protein [Acidobacteriota bacterium]